MAGIASGRVGVGARLATAAVLLASIAPAASAQRNEDAPKTPAELQRQSGHIWDMHARMRLGAVRGLRSRAFRRAIDEHRAGAGALRSDLAVTWGEFLAGTGEPFLAVALDRPADGELEAGREVAVFGELVDASGKAVASFETEDRVELAAGRALVDVSLPLPVGATRAVFGIAMRGEPRWLVERQLEPQAIDPAAFGLSRAVLSLDVHPLPKPQLPDDPFCFGGMRVAPHGERAFRPGDEPWLFVVVRAPGGAEDAPPSLTADLLLQGAGEAKPRKYSIVPATATPLRGFRNQWGLGVPLPLGSLPPGDYEASLVVSRRGTPDRATATTSFTVTAATPGS